MPNNFILIPLNEEYTNYWHTKIPRNDERVFQKAHSRQAAVASGQLNYPDVPEVNLCAFRFQANILFIDIS